VIKLWSEGTVFVFLAPGSYRAIVGY